MRLPRRIPWASISELEDVCAWIYNDEADLDARWRAVNRLSAWRAITALPHALDATLSILAVIAQDSGHQQWASSSSSSTPSGGALSLRQSYASALARLVNGLVDPLQFGAYARSIASIAAQIGLPNWIVELRHAATHEELPSLELLRDGALEAMQWLLHNFFLPTLSPQTSPNQSTVASNPLPPLAPLLKSYKYHLKITTRDVSLMPQHKPDIIRILRDIERWITQAKTGSSYALSEQQAEDERERWAMDRLCEELLQRGALVPVSIKKRPSPNEPLSISKPLLAIWEPLLQSIKILHPTFPSALISRIISYLAYPDEPAPGAQTSKRDNQSYGSCIGAWGLWIVVTWAAGENEGTASDVDETYDDIIIDILKREDVAVSLLNMLGKTEMEENDPTSIPDRKCAFMFLEALTRGHPHLERLYTTLAPVLQARPSNATWDENALAVMEERARALLGRNAVSRNGVRTDTGTDLDQDTMIVDTPATQHATVAPGWQMASDNWRPSPIGVYST